MIGLHVAVALFGFAGLFGRWLTLSPSWIVLGRTFFAALSLPLLIRIYRQPIPVPKKKEWGLLILCGGLLAFHWVAFFRSIQLTSVAVGLFAFSCFPIFVIFLEPLAFREPFRWRYLVPALFTLLGIWLMASPGGIKPFAIAGLWWGLISGLTFALLILANRFFSRSYTGMQISFYQDLFAFAFLLPIVWLHPVRLGKTDILLLLVLGVACTAIAHSLFIRGIKAVKGRTAGLIALAEPVYAVLLALIFLGEIPQMRVVAGGALVLGMTVWVTLVGD